MANYCVIMAGGVGSRFWPMSKTSTPKQFLDFLGTGETLIQQTYRRFRSFIEPENFLVVTNAIYKDQVLEQLPELKEDQVLLEPVMRNTAPCIAYAAHRIASSGEGANMIVTPADHLVMKEKEFERIMLSALDHVSTNDHLLTLGITPTRPDTGYGYIEKADGAETGVVKVSQFREKPDLATAESFLASGNFTWNSGMFIWSLASIMSAFEKQLPLMHELFKPGCSCYGSADEQAFIDEVYPKCENISIDYGIMEGSDNVYTMDADIGWSDLGTWGSVYTHLDLDDNRNAIVGNALTYDCSDCMIQMPEGKVLVAQGLEDYIVVDTKESLIILQKKEEQRLKSFRADVGEKFGKDLI